MTHQTLVSIPIELVERPTRITVVVIPRPTVQPGTRLADQYGRRNPVTATCGEFTKLVTCAGQSLIRRDHVQIAFRPAKQAAVVTQRESQEVQFRPRSVQLDDAGFLTVDRELEAAFELPFDPVAESAGLVASQDHEVVRIADDLRLRPVGRPVRPVKGLLKPVQVDVGQQRRKRSSNNVAKNGLTMHIDIPRSRLKAGYGQGTRFQQDISEKEVT